MTLKQNNYHLSAQVNKIHGHLKKLIYHIKLTEKNRKLKTMKQSSYFQIIIILLMPILIKFILPELIIIGYQKVILKALIKYFIINSNLLQHRVYNLKMIN